MTENIHLVRTLQTEINESVVEVAEKLLADAKEGKIAAIAAAVIRPNGCMNTTFSQSDNAAFLLGAIQLLSYRVMESLE